MNYESLSPAVENPSTSRATFTLPHRYHTVPAAGLVDSEMSIRTERKERPSISIKRSEAEYLRSLQYSWSEVASLLDVDHMTLYRRRQEWGLLGKGFLEILDEDLEALVVDIKAEMPDVGEQMLMDHLHVT